MSSPPRTAGADLTVSAVGFARTLRAAGLDAGPDRLHAFLGALAVLRPHRRRDVYWAGRLALCADRGDLERYERVFAAFFDRIDGAASTARARATWAEAPQPVAAPGSPREQDAELPVRAEVRGSAATEVLRQRDISDLDDVERAELDRLLLAFQLPGEARRTRRRIRSARGGLDRRRTVRRMLAAGGEPGRLAHDAPRPRPRRVVLLLDVSGSMADYTDALLRFAHAASRRRGGTTEVFTLGTRLTRVTEELAHRDPDTALRAVSQAVPDWGGGTRLAATLGEFVERWGRPGLARGAVVVVLSDGWETEDPSALGERMARLSRLAYRIVWANPRAGRPGFAPVAGGMAAALPHCDQLVEGHSLAALERLAMVVAGRSPGVGQAGRAGPGVRTPGPHRPRPVGGPVGERSPEGVR